jgi:hypothetical protein
LDLYIYKKKINLDSVYLLNFKNKELLYIGEFISGIYKKDEFIIDLELIFINPAINSSRSTTHCYKIKYDIEKNKILSIKFNFIDDN